MANVDSGQGIFRLLERKAKTVMVIVPDTASYIRG
jgi:hypothetical protein